MVICGSLILGRFLVSENNYEYNNSYSKTTIDTTTGNLSDVHFPKITICNSYKVRQSFLDTIFDASFITDDDSGYDTEEIQEAFIKHFIKI